MEVKKMEIDDSLYSRQRYMLGDHAMKKMASSSVLLIGCDCLGVEVAKNLALTGVGNLVIADSEIVTQADVSSNFYVDKSDLERKATRADACIPKLSELNPYVNITSSTIDARLLDAALGDAGPQKEAQELVIKFDCIVTTQCDLAVQMYLNTLCRELKPEMTFVGSSVVGVFSRIFCDCGSKFDVFDATGETLKEVFIAEISKTNPGVVTCIDGKMHGFDDGDSITFQEIKGMEELNGQIVEVKVLSTNAFTIGDTSTLSTYTGGGIAKQVQKKIQVSHQELEDQLMTPSLMISDLGKLDHPKILHAAMVALNKYNNDEDDPPRPWNDEDAETVLKNFTDLIASIGLEITNAALAKKIVYYLSYTCRGVLLPLAAAVGGITAQEVLKCLTGKYTPMKQFMYLDAMELLDNLPSKPVEEDIEESSLVQNCLGKQVTERLAQLKVFMVGCGAIGCEMLKNLALLGISLGEAGGKMCITDNDVIEKSNLNRQFLFRSKHVGRSKSAVAADVVGDISLGMNIQAMQHKVGPDTEQTIFNDKFFESNDIIINALDNIEARRYVDSRCVTNQRPLLESGTMGPKGHVQVIVPFATESYSNQQDPADVQFPFCTLKSFPSQIEHTIQWARDKFEAVFTQKPTTFNKFWKACQETASENLPEMFNMHLSNGGSIQDAAIAVKLLEQAPKGWEGCVGLARCKFERFFNHKARNLLQAFPLDTKLEDGSDFWSLPKRPPTPLVFNESNDVHMQFITSLAFLIASVHMIPLPKGERELEDSITTALQNAKVPEFVRSDREIVTDENAPAAKASADEDIDQDSLTEKVVVIAKSCHKISLKMSPEDFEKDDDANHHIDFISSAANLRATMYGIENVDRLKAKRIAGRIIPAISTTTSAVAGFATIQLLQLVLEMMTKKKPSGETWTSLDREEVVKELAKYRNCFINLAIPLIIFSEPAAPERTTIADGVSFTEWDRWEVHGNKEFKLKDFVHHFKSKLNLQVSAMLQGCRMVYIPAMPGHAKRLDNAMTKLIKAGPAVPYVDLTVTFENIKGDEDISCPIIRYYF